MTESSDASKQESYSSEQPNGHTSDSLEDNKPSDNIDANQPLQPVYFTSDPEPLPEPPLSKPPLTTTTATTYNHTASGDEDNINNVLSNVVAPSVLGGLGAVGLIAIGLNAPTKEVQVTSEDGTTNTTVAKDYLPSLSMGAGTEFFLYGFIVMMLATIIGSIGVLSLIGVPKKEERAKTWQIGIVYALLFPTAISALIQNQFLGGQQASVQTRTIDQEQNSRVLQNSTIEEIQGELIKAHQQLRVSTEIIAAPTLFSFPQQNLIIGNQQSIAELDRLRRDLEEMKQ